MSRKTKTLVGITIGVSIIILIIAIVTVQTNSNAEKEIVGNWQIAETNNPYGYPNNITFYENGTFMSEDLEDFGIYLIDDNYITTKYDGTILWEYDLSKNKLMLRCTDIDYQGYIEYKRIK